MPPKTCSTATAAGRGGDLIRFVQLFLDLPFRQTVAHLEQELLPNPVFRLLEGPAAFYQLQLHRHPEAADYLERRGVHDSSLIEELGIGYAPGGNLRRHLAAWGSSFDQLLEIGLINHHGRGCLLPAAHFSLPTARANRQPLWPQHWRGVPPPSVAALQRRIVRLGIRQQVLHGNPLTIIRINTVNDSSASKYGQVI
jgi:hypothetical protein